MKTCRYGKRRGMTLIEVTLAMTLGLVVAGMLMALVGQQIAFLRTFSRQTFLIDEAPMVSMHVGRMAGKADRFSLHASVGDALADRNRRLSSSPVLLMTFQQPDGSIRSSIVSFEARNGRQELNYYLVPASGTASLGTPQWSITRQAQNVAFTVEQGVLRMTLTGPAGERITYSGTMQQ